MLKAIIFDMDGVISDSEPANLEANNLVLKKCGVHVPLQYFEQYLGTTHEHMWNTMQEEFQLPYNTDQCIRFYRENLKHILAKEGLRPIPGVVDLIHRLYEEGFSLAVASSNMPDVIRSNMEHFGLTSYFDVMVSGKNCAHGKPYPDIFLKTAKELHVSPEECLVIEDSKNGISAAKAASMTCIGFQNPNFVPQDIHRADYIVSDFQDITGELCRHLTQRVS